MRTDTTDGLALARIDIAGTEYSYVPLSEVLSAAELAATPYALRVLVENVARRAPESLQAVIDRLRDRRRDCELPFHPNRIMLHDTTCLPALADFAAMRDMVAELGGDPERLQPSIPVDLTVDHSVIAEQYGRPDALALNLEADFRRNSERYTFIKWAERSVANFGVVPPGTGIIHQVNMESLATAVWTDATTMPPTLHPDVLVATDSHTPMINAIGIVGWGVGGLQGQAAMLGEPVTIAFPDVVGVAMTGRLRSGVTGTDLALTVTRLLRELGVVDKFVEFHGPGAHTLGWADRAAVSNMAPEYGATVALFPTDEQTMTFLRLSGRSAEHCDVVRQYLTAQHMFARPDSPTPVYDEIVELDLDTIKPSLAGPHMPHQLVGLGDVASSFRAAVGAHDRRGADPVFGEELPEGPLAIAAITSCTNTANPTLMVQAGLLARRAAAAGLTTKPWVKTTLSPGSQVVTSYLTSAGLQNDFDQLGFYTVGFGCMTCIGNSGPMHPRMEELVNAGVRPAAVLSGNRNFAGRVNPRLDIAYLASPPLVVAYALAGSITHDFATQPLGHTRDGDAVYLADIWPDDDDVTKLVAASVHPDMFQRNSERLREGTPAWRELTGPSGTQYEWQPSSTYIRRPPYLTNVTVHKDDCLTIRNARTLLHLGDNITTDHISPAGAIPHYSLAGRYLTDRGVKPRNFNQYSTRRSNHEVMMRGAFTNPAIRNKILPSGFDKVGGWTYTADRSEIRTVFDAAATYAEAAVPTIIFAGCNYGAGSSRDWAAKAPSLFGVKAIVAKSFERIHRSNLIGMGILPLTYANAETVENCGLDGTENIDIVLDNLAVGVNDVTMSVRSAHGEMQILLHLRVDTVNEVTYLQHGGTLRYVVRKALNSESAG